MTDFSPETRQASRSKIGARLKKARRNSGVTGLVLAKKLNVRNDSLSQMENGKQIIPAELLADWCSVLCVPVSSILSPNTVDGALEEDAVFYMTILSELNADHRSLVLKHLEMVYNHERKERERNRAP
ncbi:helix-turn-helix transcriptional regulator [Microbulbifer sp. VAAF005]|uniref:helix-turn-helix domain-containing protein n=1 Tax=Microbulbifer sp. VAAF005 TaxID=3034230 RepID=UPI0024ADC475|nr:helix-turn-helix transcriptional regulator [Microbulbifer sp. VAAF005]WHI45022.1 helix-turn-helix transcriptional regulator [Microbulbifer sp. VAAF005]